MSQLLSYALAALNIIKEHPVYLAVFLPVLLALTSRRWSAIVGCVFLALGGFAGMLWSQDPAFIVVGPALSTLAGGAIALCAIEARRAQKRTRSQVHHLLKRVHAAEQLITSLQERQVLHRINGAEKRVRQTVALPRMDEPATTDHSQPVIQMRVPVREPSNHAG
jgi:hypothetical protein